MQVFNQASRITRSDILTKVIFIVFSYQWFEQEKGKHVHAIKFFFWYLHFQFIVLMMTKKVA